MPNVAVFLDATAARRPDATAIVYKDLRYSYGQMHRLANRVANGLTAAGFGPGDRIGICCANRPGFLPCYYGAFKIGATAVILSDTINETSLAYELDDAEVDALLVYDARDDAGPGEMALTVAERSATCRRSWVIPPDPMGTSQIAGAETLADLMAGQADSAHTHAFGPDETALILYTSGSTGKPKGVEMTQSGIEAMTLLNLVLAERDMTPVRLVLAPMYDIAAQIFSLNLPVLSGETMVLMEDWDVEEAWRLIVDERVAYVAEMPVYYRWLLDHADRVDHRRVRESLRLCPTGGAELPAAWSEEFEDRFGVPIRPGYGMTEAGSTISWNTPFWNLRTETTGPAIPGVAVKVVDRDLAPLPAGRDGEILVRTPGAMKGYLNLPEATAAAFHDGWLRTNDIGCLDEEGYLQVRGRADGMINRGYEHIYPAEIVMALHQHPAVTEAAVIAVPDPALGQEAKALVVPRPETGISEAALLDWLVDELPNDRAPGLLEFRTALPRTDNGKIAYAQLH